MTDTTTTTQMAVLKTDSRGRVQTPVDQREALMDAFEQSAMSGAAFARLHGIKYSTFAHWRKLRRQQHNPPPTSDESRPFFEEVTLPETNGAEAGLVLHFPGRASLSIHRPDQFPLVAALLKYMEHTC